MGYHTDAAALYAQMNEIQTDRGLDLMEAAAPQNGERVLDLGCGTGNLTRELARRVGPEGSVLGLDPDMDRLDVARMTTPNELTNLRFELGRGEALDSVDSNSRDMVFSNYVVHWVDAREDLLREVYRCLKPGGRATFEFCGHFSEFVQDLVDETLASGQSFPNPFSVYPPSDWREMLERVGFEVDQCELLQISYHYASYEEFAAWWEGTTHGTVGMDRLDPAYIEKLQRYFDGGGVFASNSIRFRARKP